MLKGIIQHISCYTLALKLAVTDKFHDYLYVSKFKVVTDSNPLTYILTSAKLCATRQRWVAAPSAYDFRLTYWSRINNADVDDLSRKAIEVTKFPEVLKATSTLVTASGQSAPYVQTLVISAVPVLNRMSHRSSYKQQL